MKPFYALLLPILLAPASGEEPVSKKNSGPRLTLQAATEAAAANNPAIHEARAKWEAAKARVPQAAAWDDLKISANSRVGRFVNIAPNGFTDQTVSIEQSIPLSGRNQSRGRIAAAEAAGALQALRRKELDVALRVRAAYIRLANGYAQLELNQANEASLTQTRDISRAKLEVGGQSEADVLLAEAELIKANEARRDLERGISEEETQLKVLMNRDVFGPLGRPADDLPEHAAISLERVRGVMLAHRPELLAAQANAAAARAKVELAKRAWTPDPAVTLQAQRYNEASQAVSELDAGVSFSVPWLNGAKYRAGEKEAESGAEAAQRALQGAETEALGLLRDQTEKIEIFHHHIELFRERLAPTTQQTVEAELAGYQADKTTFFNLVSAQRSLLEVQSMARQHVADYQLALAELEALAGADLNLFSTAKRALNRRSK